jgi:hypothetical protein
MVMSSLPFSLSSSFPKLFVSARHFAIHRNTYEIQDMVPPFRSSQPDVGRQLNSTELPGQPDHHGNTGRTSPTLAWLLKSGFISTASQR